MELINIWSFTLGIIAFWLLGGEIISSIQVHLEICATESIVSIQVDPYAAEHATGCKFISEYVQCYHATHIGTGNAVF